MSKALISRFSPIIRTVITTLGCIVGACSSSPHAPMVIAPASVGSRPQFEVEKNTVQELSKQLAACAVEYAHPRERSKLTATELADAALSFCADIAEKISAHARSAYILDPSIRPQAQDAERFGRAMRNDAERSAREAVMRDIADNT